jgi:hypothetical protein
MHTVNYFRSIEQKSRAEGSGIRGGGRGGRSSLTGWRFDACDAVTRFPDSAIGGIPIRGPLFENGKTGKRESGGRPQRGIKAPTSCASGRFLGFRPPHRGYLASVTIPRKVVYTLSRSPCRFPPASRVFIFNRVPPGPTCSLLASHPAGILPAIVRPAKRGLSSRALPCHSTKSREDRHCFRRYAISRSL